MHRDERELMVVDGMMAALAEVLNAAYPEMLPSERAAMGPKIAALLVTHGNGDDYNRGVVHLAALLMNMEPSDMARKLGVENYEEGTSNAV